MVLHPSERRPAEGWPARGSSSSSSSSLLSETGLLVDGDSGNSNEVEEGDEAKDLETWLEVEAVKGVSRG